MTDFNLHNELMNYEAFDSNEELMLKKCIELINTNPTCFEKDNYNPGHFVGSGYVIDKSHKYLLMTHHQKYNLWLALGGHSDGNPDTLGVAKREIWEESGLKNFKQIGKGIFDVDVHTILPHKDQPQHLHYDIRFLFEADMNEPLIISDESKDLKWVAIDEVHKYNSAEEIKRPVQKIRII